MEYFRLKIYRGVEGKRFWDEFQLEAKSGMNIISALMELQKDPVNTKGVRVEPINWEMGCLEEVCGSCSMLINGRPRQACSTIVKELLEKTGSDVITLAPLSKFPVVRDLVVDRSPMFEMLKDIHGWIDVDGTFVKGFGPKVAQESQEKMYVLSTCMTCGCCTEACPQFNDKSSFIGPAAISQARLFNEHPTGKMKEDLRLGKLMEKGGVAECGNAQNCVQVCPKEIPLTESIAEMGRNTTKQAWKKLFS